MKSDFKKAISNSIIYSFGTFAPKLVGFILLPIYSKYFSITDFGVIGILEATAQIIIGIFGFGLYQGYFRWYFEDEAVPKRKGLFFTLLIVHIIIGIGLIITVIPLSKDLAVLLKIGEKNNKLILLLIFSSILQLIAVIPTTLMRLQEKAKLYSLTNLFQALIILSSNLILIRHFKMGIESIYYSQIFGLLIFIVFSLNYIIKNCSISFERRLLKKIINFSFPLLLSTIAVLILNQADRYFIQYFGVLDDVGLFTFGNRIANTLSILVISSFSFAIQPIIFKKMNDPDSKAFYSKTLTYSTILISILALLLAVFAKEIVYFFAKQDAYYNSYKIIPLCSLAIVFMLMKDISIIGLQIVKKTKIIAICIIISAMLSIILNITLIPILGINGAALAKAISAFIFFTLILQFSQKYYYIHFEYTKIFKIILIGSIVFIPTLFIDNNCSSIFMTYILKSLLSLFFPFGLIIFKVFNPSELIYLKSFFLNLLTNNSKIRNKN